MSNRRAFVGWVAVGISTLIAGFWAYWGSIETFHEGWYFHSIWKNVGLTFIDGQVWPVRKKTRLGYHAFRTVREVVAASDSASGHSILN